jgi:hypothetical protein
MLRFLQGIPPEICLLEAMPCDGVSCCPGHVVDSQRDALRGVMPSEARFDCKHRLFGRTSIRALLPDLLISPPAALQKICWISLNSSWVF